MKITFFFFFLVMNDTFLRLHIYVIEFKFNIIDIAVFLKKKKAALKRNENYLVHTKMTNLFVRNIVYK